MSTFAGLGLFLLRPVRMLCHASQKGLFLGVQILEKDLICREDKQLFLKNLSARWNFLLASFQTDSNDRDVTPATRHRIGRVSHRSIRVILIDTRFCS